jgi:hypothetical protein
MLISIVNYTIRIITIIVTKAIIVIMIFFIK